MSKRKTELERKEDLLSVLSNKDHDKVIAFQKQLGITIGTLIDILTVGEICVSKTTDINPNAVESRPVRLSVGQNAWLFVDGNKDDGYGVGRSVKAIGETYALTAPEMEEACNRQLVEQAEALEKAADSLEAAGLRTSAEELRNQAKAKHMATEKTVPAK